MTHTVRHGRVELALHELRVGDGERRLLLLHGLGERTPAEPPAWTAGWPGAVWGLDFTGHGGSTRPAGGGYTAEMLMADTDAALAELGPSTVLGRGVGAYVALLVAGARPALARGAVLADGPGLWGGGPVPSSIVLSAADGMPGTPDPWAMSELSRDVRPPDYATGFARQATQLSGLDWPVSVCARARPPWLEAVATEPGVVETTVTEALELYAAES